MSFATAIAQLVTVVQGCRVDSQPNFRHIKNYDGRKTRCFWFEALGGGIVVPTNQRRHVVDMVLYVTYDKPKSASANRYAQTLEIVKDIEALCERLLDVVNLGRPASGIIRLSVDGRESMAWVREEDDETIQVKISFPLEHT